MNPVTEVINSEIEKCSHDAVYFIKNYFTIQHPIKGVMKFQLHPFQEKVIEGIVQGDNTIINKSRQMGISTLLVAISLWKALFRNNMRILMVGTKQAVSVNHNYKLQFAYESLPFWFKHMYPLQSASKQLVEFKNGASIKMAPVPSNPILIEEFNDLVLDECAWIGNMYDFMRSIHPSIRQANGQIVAVSSPNKVGNWFANTFFQAQHAMNAFKPIELPWSVHPDRDGEWYKRETNGMTEDEIAEEFNCQFLPIKK